MYCFPHSIPDSHKIEEIRAGRFKVSLSQGINARMLSDEAAAALASIDYRNDAMTRPCIHTAWDNAGDEKPLFRGLKALVKYGVKPYHITVYMLVGWAPGETEASRLERWQKLVDFGALPYPMPFVRSRELVGFQRWIVGTYARKGVPWEAFKRAGYEPRRLGLEAS